MVGALRARYVRILAYFNPEIFMIEFITQSLKVHKEQKKYSKYVVNQSKKTSN